MEKISVLVPVYNAEKYIEKCIKSIINQTYKNIEIILIDDESKDDSLNIMKKMQKQDDRIKIISIKNQGVADARNKALENSTGTFVTFVDSDDTIDNDYLEVLYSNLEKYNADIAVINCKNVIEETGKVLHKDFGIKKIKEYNNVEAVKDLFYYNFLRHSPWGKLYKKKVWENIKFPLGKNYEDLAIIYKTFLNANRIIYIPEEKYNYLIREGSIVHNEIRKTDVQAIIEYCGKILEDINKNYPELTKATEFLLVDHELYLWYRIPDNKEYKEYLKIAKANVKKYRKNVLKDKNVSKKHKMAIILSYLGRSIYKKAIEINKRRSGK